MDDPLLVDVFEPDGSAHLWVTLVDDEFSEDLSLDLCGEDSVGTLRERPGVNIPEGEPKEGEFVAMADIREPSSTHTPEWLEYELESAGLEGILSPTYRHVESKDDLGIFRSTWLEWGLRRGIAPGQPFQMYIEPPRYTRDYEGDCDVEWDCVEIERVQPWPNHQVIAAWDRFFTRVNGFRTRVRQALRKLREQQLSDLSALYLTYDRYYVGHYHEMDFPDGVSVSLCTKHVEVKVDDHPQRLGHVLAHGRDDSGEHTIALEHLREAAERLNSAITPGFLNGLPVQRF